MAETPKKKTTLADYDLVVQESPHFFEPWTSQWKMLQVVLVLIFVAIAASFIFGYQVLIHCAVSVLVAVLTEYLYEMVVRKRFTVTNLSAVVTGMSLALTMPNGASPIATGILSFIAIFFFKMLPGGMGKNRFNPAAAARALYILYPWFVNGYITGFGPDGVSTASYAQAITPAGQQTMDAVSRTTPLYYLSWGNTTIPEGAPNLWNLFLGNQGGWGGAIGETVTIVILLGMIYLILRRIISLNGPIIMLSTLFIVMLVWSGFNVEFALYHLLSGGAIFAATFMITDYPTTGITPIAKLIYPLGVGLLSGLFRITGFSPEGVIFSILIMNAIIPYVDSVTMPKIYGHKKRPNLGVNYDDNEPFVKKDVLAGN